MCWGSGVSPQDTTAEGGGGQSQRLQDADGTIQQTVWNEGGWVAKRIDFFLGFLVVIQIQHDVTFEELLGKKRGRKLPPMLNNSQP